MKIINGIIVYDSSEITSNDLYNNHIIKNIPCVIRNFNPEKSKMYVYYQQLKSTPGSIAHLDVGYKENYVIDPFFKSIANKTQFSNVLRTWLHQKGNYTPLHYDGNGIDVLNICINGSKRFYLSPPRSLQVYPLSNISITRYFKTPLHIDIFKTDMIYIPCYWFHSVLTLEDNTYNVNYSLIHDFTNKYTSLRDKYVFSMHNYLNSYMCSDTYTPICNTINKKGFLESFIYCFIEMLPLLFITSIITLPIINIILKSYPSIIPLLPLILQLLTFLSLMFSFSLLINVETVGILGLITFYISIFFGITSLILY